MSAAQEVRSGWLPCSQDEGPSIRVCCRKCKLQGVVGHVPWEPQSHMSGRSFDTTPYGCSCMNIIRNSDTTRDLIQDLQRQSKGRCTLSWTTPTIGFLNWCCYESVKLKRSLCCNTRVCMHNIKRYYSTRNTTSSLCPLPQQDVVILCLWELPLFGFSMTHNWLVWNQNQDAIGICSVSWLLNQIKSE